MFSILDPHGFPLTWRHLVYLESAQVLRLGMHANKTYSVEPVDNAVYGAGTNYLQQTTTPGHD